MSEAAAADLLSDGDLLSSDQLASTPLSGTSLSLQAQSDPRRRDKNRQVSVVAVSGSKRTALLSWAAARKGFSANRWTQASQTKSSRQSTMICSPSAIDALLSRTGVIHCRGK